MIELSAILVAAITFPMKIFNNILLYPGCAGLKISSYFSIGKLAYNGRSVNLYLEYISLSIDKNALISSAAVRNTRISPSVFLSRVILITTSAAAAT